MAAPFLRQVQRCDARGGVDESRAKAKVSSVLALSTTVTSARNGNDSSRNVRRRVIRATRCGASLKTGTTISTSSRPVREPHKVRSAGALDPTTPRGATKVPPRAASPTIGGTPGARLRLCGHSPTPPARRALGRKPTGPPRRFPWAERTKSPFGDPSAPSLRWTFPGNMNRLTYRKTAGDPVPWRGGTRGDVVRGDQDVLPRSPAKAAGETTPPRRPRARRHHGGRCAAFGGPSHRFRALCRHGLWCGTTSSRTDHRGPLARRRLGWTLAHVGLGTAWHMRSTAPGFFFMERSWMTLFSIRLFGPSSRRCSLGSPRSQLPSPWSATSASVAGSRSVRR